MNTMRLFLISLLATASLASALAAASPSKSKLQLKYFDARGAAETVRILLAVGKEEYEDIRYEIAPGTMEAPAFKEAKEKGDLIANMDRAPVLVVDGDNVIGQSKAIERFLSRRYKLMGNSEIEAAQIDCVTEHCRDVKDAQMRKRFSAFVKDRTDEEKAVDQKQWFEEEMPEMLARLQAAIQVTSKAKGCAVGDSLSLADLAIFALLSDGFPVYKKLTQQAAEACPALLDIVKAVESHPEVAAWLEKRPDNMF